MCVICCLLCVCQHAYTWVCLSIVLCILMMYLCMYVCMYALFELTGVLQYVLCIVFYIILCCIPLPWLCIISINGPFVICEVAPECRAVTMYQWMSEWVSQWVLVCVCVCVCVRERERERECVCACVCLIEKKTKVKWRSINTQAIRAVWIGSVCTDASKIII